MNEGGRVEVTRVEKRHCNHIHMWGWRGGAKEEGKNKEEKYSY